MSVLIKNIKTPESCAECRFCVNGFTDAAPVYECACESNENVSVLVDDHGKPFNFRPDWCPLVEVPTPHGRLIDADEIEYENWYLEETGESYKSYKMVGKDDIDGMSAIIEAEGSVNENNNV